MAEADSITYVHLEGAGGSIAGHSGALHFDIPGTYAQRFEFVTHAGPGHGLPLGGLTIGAVKHTTEGLDAKYMAPMFCDYTGCHYDKLGAVWGDTSYFEVRVLDDLWLGVFGTPDALGLEPGTTKQLFIELCDPNCQDKNRASVTTLNVQLTAGEDGCGDCLSPPCPPPSPSPIDGGGGGGSGGGSGGGGGGCCGPNPTPGTGPGGDDGGPGSGLTPGSVPWGPGRSGRPVPGVWVFGYPIFPYWSGDREVTSTGSFWHATPMIQLPDLPLMPLRGNPYLYDVQFECTCGSPGIDCYLKATAKLRGTGTEYEFRSATRDGLVNPRDWIDQEEERPAIQPLSLYQIRKIRESDRTYVPVVHGQYDDDDRAMYWYDAGQPDLSLAFEYDDQFMTKAIASYGQEVNLRYEEVPFGQGNEMTSINLTEISSDCGSCPSYHYEYDGCYLTAVKDGNNEHTLAAYRYGPVGFAGDYADRTMVTKSFRQPYGGNPVVVYEAQCNTSPHNACTHYTFQSNTCTQVMVEQFSGAGGDLAYRRFYTDLNPNLSTGHADSYSYTYWYDDSDGRKLTKRQEQLPTGLQKRSYLGTYGASAGRVAKSTVYGEEREITLQEYTYDIIDGRALPQSFVDVRGGMTMYHYNASGVLTQLTEPQVSLVGGGTAQQSTRYYYDSRLQLTRQRERGTDGAYVYTEYERDDRGNVTKMIEDADGALKLTTQYEYDGANRLVTTTDARSVKSVSKYADSGTLLREYTLALDGSGRALSLVLYDYDSLGHLTKTRRARQNDPIENPAVANPPTIDTVYEYDSYGRRTQVIEDFSGLNLTTKYEYDNQDRIVKTTQPDGRYTRTERDGRGRPIRQIVGYEGGGTGSELTTSYQYDGSGNLTSETSPKGVRTEYRYDGLDRRTARLVKPVE